MIKKILWVFFLLTAAYQGYQSYLLQTVPPFHERIDCLEFASKAHGAALLQSWQAQSYGGQAFLQIAVTNTHLDFFFIFLYTSLILMLSYLQMQRDPGICWNELLRANLVFGALAACLDILENIFLLYDFRHAGEPGLYISTHWISLLKFIFIGWALSVYLVSLARTQLFNK
ncbi:hypothetical protein KXD93_22195 [Mucilaginibacter sp. BJC16-A38]|uniref:hypothetical protein n=1 Tax=Mucilaginibacter phenanthrenivorans TaxID=1234842 RepID=UPI0021585705|nr:hypothetical protein [Mucilaginibacter phenanthrenivorans]MCR8560381.1 hypothetical protein [Mucilaginibacter phenanthrenivorans]